MEREKSKQRNQVRSEGTVQILTVHLDPKAKRGCCFTLIYFDTKTSDLKSGRWRRDMKVSPFKITTHKNQITRNTLIFRRKKEKEFFHYNQISSTHDLVSQKGLNSLAKFKLAGAVFEPKKQ